MSLLHRIPVQREPHRIRLAEPVPAGCYISCTCGTVDCRPTRAEALDSWLDHCLFRSLIEATA